MWKGHRRLLLALYLIRDLRWTCLIAGEPQNDIQIKYLAELRRMVGSLELDGRVRFIGQQKDVRRLLAASDVLCQANEGPEGFSMTFLEALSTGLPIVTTRLGGAPEAIDGTCGLLAPAFDDQEFASALRRIILEPELRSALARGALERAAMFQPEVQLRRLNDALVHYFRGT